MIWLDALDLPLVYGIEASYAIEGPPAVGRQADRLGRCALPQRRRGAVPLARRAARAVPDAAFPVARRAARVGRTGDSDPARRSRAARLRQPGDRARMPGGVGLFGAPAASGRGAAAAPALRVGRPARGRGLGHGRRRRGHASLRNRRHARRADARRRAARQRLGRGIGLSVRRGRCAAAAQAGNLRSAFSTAR